MPFSVTKLGCHYAKTNLSPLVSDASKREISMNIEGTDLIESLFRGDGKLRGEGKRFR